MSDDQMFERNARAWLELGPSAAPRRAVDGALLTIATTPQQRDLRVSWRLPQMAFSRRFALVAAIAVFAAGGAFLLFVNRPHDQVANPPSPSPSPTAASVSAVSAVLQARWTSIGGRPVPGENPDVPTDFVVGPTDAHIPLFRVDVKSSWSLANNDSRLLLNFGESFAGYPPQSSWDCQAGDEGTYGLSFSAGAQRMTLSTVSDPCLPRSAILAGDWARSPCPAVTVPDPDGYIPNPLCTTELVPGRHVAHAFRPFGGGRSGQVAYTLPTGWGEQYVPPSRPEYDDDQPASLALRLVSATDETAITVYSTVVATGDCTARPPDDGTPAGIAEWLTKLPGLVVSAATPVTIGGLDGVQVDVSVAPGWTSPCITGSETLPNGSTALTYEPGVVTFADYTRDPPEEVFLGLQLDSRARYVVLDRGDGKILLIVVQHDAAAGWDALLADAMPVIDTFEFTTGLTPRPTLPASTQPSIP